MFTVIYFVMAAMHAVAFYFILRLFLRERVSYTLIATLTIFGLFYDNLIIGLGNFIGEGGLLETLNAIRFYFHALITPLMIIFAYGVIRQVMGKGKNDKIWHSVFCILAVVMLALGAMTDVINLSLIPEIENGTLRYVNDASEGPPIPAIITIIVMIIVGIFMWRHASWPWLAIGSIVMFVAAALGVNNVILSNLGEVVFAVAIVTMDYRVHREEKATLVTGNVIRVRPARV